MTLQERKNALIALGERLQQISNEELAQLTLRTINENNWFNEANVSRALTAWAQALSTEEITTWTKEFEKTTPSVARVGLIMAGNIPLVGLHDLITVLVSGHRAVVKLSSQDTVLMQFIIRELLHIAPAFEKQIEVVEQLKDIDAVIATGSDNTARYFKQYFGNKPHIIRQNRTSIAILNGQESTETLHELGKDIFTYYGLGCRNVAKVFLPKDADITNLIDGLMGYEEVLTHHKYLNNYDYNKSIYLVNGEPHLDSGFFLMRETEELVSPISVLYYERYDNEAQLALRLATFADKTQCMVSDQAWYPNSINFGAAQSPELWDYADGVNTLDFLAKLS